LGAYVEDYPLDYVHCNLGWGLDRSNGWYISGIFDVNNIPEVTRSVGISYFFQYKIMMLTGIRKRDN